jgi:hypothetical protein
MSGDNCKFYAIINPNSSGLYRGENRFPDLKTAEAIAEELARKYNCRLFVLEAIESFQPANLPINKTICKEGW